MEITFVLVFLFVWNTEGLETIRELITREGDTIILNCNGSYRISTWRGPDIGNKQIPYFDGPAFNPNMQIQNIGVVINVGYESYNLIIYNFSAINVGLYTCQIKESKLGSFRVNKYTLLLRNVSENENIDSEENEESSQVEQLYTLSTDAYNVNSKEDFQNWLNIISGGIIGILLVSFICSHIACHLKRHRQTQDFDLPPDNEVQYDEVETIDYNIVGHGIITANSMIMDVDTNSQSSNSSLNFQTVNATNTYVNDYQPLVQMNEDEHKYEDRNIMISSRSSSSLDNLSIKHIFVMQTLADSAGISATSKIEEDRIVSSIDPIEGVENHDKIQNQTDDMPSYCIANLTFSQELAPLSPFSFEDSCEDHIRGDIAALEKPDKITVTTLYKNGNSKADSTLLEDIQDNMITIEDSISKNRQTI